MSAGDRRARFREPARPRAAVRDAEPLGRRLGPAARVVRLRGARDDERRARLVARQARPGGVPRRAGRARGEPRRTRRRCRSTSTASAATRTTRAAWPRPWRCSPTPGRRASRSRTTTRPPAASTTSRSRPSGSPLPPQAAHRLADPMVLTGRAENHIRGVDDLDDTIARLIAYRDAGADVVYAPGLHDLEQIAAVVEAVGVPVNVLALRTGRPSPSWPRSGVRRVSTGGSLAAAAYGALLEGARELLADGTSSYASRGVTGEALRAAFEHALPSVHSEPLGSCALQRAARLDTRPLGRRDTEAVSASASRPRASHPGRAPRERADVRAARATRR